MGDLKSALAHETVWLEKSKYDEAERIYHEKLARNEPANVNHGPQAKGDRKQKVKKKLIVF